MNSVSSAWFTGIPRTYFDHPQYIGLVCSRSNTQPSTQKNPNILLVILHVKTCQNSIEPTGVYQPLLVHFRSHHPGIFHGDPFRGSDIGAETQPGDGWRIVGYAVYHWDLHGFMMVYGDSNLYSVNEEIKAESIEDASFLNMKNNLLLLVTYNDLTTLWTVGQGNDFQAPPWPRKVLPSPRRCWAPGW